MEITLDATDLFVPVMRNLWMWLITPKKPRPHERPDEPGLHIPQPTRKSTRKGNGQRKKTARKPKPR
jgi:hypothetical protein